MLLWFARKVPKWFLPQALTQGRESSHVPHLSACKRFRKSCMKRSRTRKSSPEVGPRYAGLENHLSASIASMQPVAVTT
jgi:hypothetical protein